MNFAQKDIDNAVEELSERVNLAAVGLLDWQEIPKTVTELFPGALSSIQNFDHIENTIPFIEAVGLAPEHLQSYVDYFHTINPYEPYWKGHDDGEVWVSDYVLPVHLLKHNEFYNDWLRKIGEFDSAIGVRLEATAENEVRFNLHFPTTLLESYEHPSGELINRLRAPLKRAIEISNHVSDNQIEVATSAALLDRGDKAACVVDYSGRLKDCNPLFENLLIKDSLFGQRNNRIILKDHKSTDAFALMIRQIALRASHPLSKQIVRTADGDWVLSFSRLPEPSKVGSLLHVPLVLILVTKLSDALWSPDLGEFGRAFGLTPAELRLCSALDRGLSLSDAAIDCKISYETARSRIKIIFQKTGTTKQVELLLMLLHFRTA